MRKTWMVIAIALAFASCLSKKQGCQSVPPEKEIRAMAYFCDTSHILYQEHDSGLFYEVLSPGEGDSITAVNALLTVAYKGVSLFNNQVFEQHSTNDPVQLKFSSLITGWQLGIPKIRKGGHLLLIIPSALALGCTGNGTIPPNTPLFYDIHLMDVAQ